MDFLRETPQSKGFADIHNLRKGYAVLTYNNGRGDWNLECNSWGMLYESKGNAINKALKQTYGGNRDRVVIQLPDWKIIWSSWEEGKND